MVDETLLEANIRLWSQVIIDQKNSGMRIDDYCHAIDISRNQFYYWQRKIKKYALSKATPTVVEISLPAEEATPTSSTTPVSLDTGFSNTANTGSLQMYVNGVTLNISVDTSMALLKKVLEVIHA